MFFRFNRRLNLLTVDDTFASLIRIHENNDLEFEFRYTVNQIDVVQRNALTVNVSVMSKAIERRSVLGDSHRGHVNTRVLPMNIRQHVQNAKLSVKERESYTVAFRRSDVTVKINNEIVPQIRAGVPAKLINSLQRTVLVPVPVIELRQDNNTKPLLQVTAHPSLDQGVDSVVSASVELDTKRIMNDMVARQGIDPSNVVQLTHRSISARNAFEGMLRPSRSLERSYDPAVQLLHHYLFNNNDNPFRRMTSQVQDDVVVNVDDVVTNNIVEVPVKVTIPHSKRSVDGELASNFLVKFDVIDGRTGIVVDQVVKQLDVSRHIQLFYTPRKPPIVKVSSSDTSPHLNMEIKQVDAGATAVQVYRKVLYRTSFEIDDYVLVGVYPLTSRQQALTVQVERSLVSPVIYRVIPVGEEGTQGFEYTNVIVKPTRFRPKKSVSVIASTSETGVEVEVRNVSTDVIAVEVLRRNLSIFEKEYTNVGNITLIDEETRTANHFKVSDDSVKEGRVYEYVARLHYHTGTSELSGNSTIEYVIDRPGKVDVRISDVQVSHDSLGPNVTFVVRSLVLDSDLDVIKTLLEKQGISEFFEGDIVREREFLRGLIAHRIERIDLTSGVRETFGVVTDENFSDRDFRRNNQVLPLQYGRKYRYEVATLIRQSETLFEEFKKTKIDSVTKKPYTFSPIKFLHPVTLNRGMILTPAGAKLISSKEPLSHGIVGSVESVEVSFDNEPARIIDPVATRFDRNLNIIRWKLEGSIDQVDHFLVIKDVHGVRTVIGKSHSEFEFGNCQHVHSITEQDRGGLRYVIVPIFNDYSIGVPITTNAII